MQQQPAVPVTFVTAAHSATFDPGRDELVVQGLMASLDGRVVLRSSLSGSWLDPDVTTDLAGATTDLGGLTEFDFAAELGTRLAEKLLAAGGADLLDLGVGSGYDAS